MAQAFVTTYKNHYRWNDPVKPEPIRPQSLGDILPDNDPELWLLPKTISEDDTGDQAMNLTKAKEAVKRMQMRKMRTTYHVSYCREKKAHKEGQTGLDDSEIGNQLLEYCKKLYGRRDRTLLPPLPTLRRVNGYIRYAKLYTPLTVYQDDVGRIGYNILNK